MELGFFFDHTTGLPMIPGSSVKGSLRSAFMKDKGGYVKSILKELDEKNRKTDEKADKALISTQAHHNIDTDIEYLIKVIVECKDNGRIYSGL
ncbi:MAG: RAMP superfamily CRISPR-associated protein [Bacteroidota bacterium]|nr:RAMP superfamily CRISPR-associated protein [Bacteroidota bacterium]